MTKPCAVIFVHTQRDVEWALKYFRDHPETKIIPTDIAALTSLVSAAFPHITYLDHLVSYNKTLDLYLRLPFKLSLELIKNFPGLTLWVDVVRADLTKALSHYYTLYQVLHLTHGNTFFVSQKSFLPQVVSLFATANRVKLKFLPNPNLTLFQQLSIIIFSAISQIKWWPHYYQELFNSLIPRSILPPVANQKKILFFSNGLNLASYHSVIKNLRRQHITVQLLTDIQSWKDKLYLTKYKLIAPELPQTPTLAEQRQIKTFLSHLPSVNSLKLNGDFKLPFISKNTLAKLFRLVAQATIDRTKTKIAAKYILAQHLFQAIEPQQLVVTHDPGPSALTFVLTAKKQKIPTTVLLHGSPSHIHFFFSDCQIIWGKLMREWLVAKAKVDPRKLLLGGHPIYTNYLKYFTTHKSTSDIFTIGIITSGDGRYEWYQAYYFLDLFTHLSQLQFPFRLIIRTHGMQHLGELKQLARKFNISLDLNHTLHLEEFVASGDIFIAQNSSATLVPLLAQKPIVLKDPWFPFTDEGLIKYSSALKTADTWDEVITFINQFKNGKYRPMPSTQAFIKSYCGPISPAAAAKISSQIRSQFKKPHVTAIVQARMGATRLPGKVLKKIMGKPMLELQLERLKHSREIDEIVIATSTNSVDQKIVNWAHKIRQEVYRGSETDVLDRFYQAAKKYQANIIIRLTGDCPLIDPNIVDQTIKAFIKGDYDYASNVHVRSYPRGMDTEVMSFSCLETAWKKAKSKYNREHVTAYIYSHPDKFRLKEIIAPTKLHRPELRLTVDEIDDFRLINKIYETLYSQNPNFSLTEIIDLFNKNPKLSNLNQQVQQTATKYQQTK